MGKRRAFLLFVLLLGLMVSGCTRKPSGKAEAIPSGYAPNEILTYDKLEDGKTPLYIGVIENDDIIPLVDAFAREYPTVQPIVLYLQVGDACYSPACSAIKHGYGPDIVFNCDFGPENGTYLEDLSSYDETSLFEDESLAQNDEDGHLYALPGPAKIMGILYNKNLFDTYHLEIPKTFEDFLTLTDTITKVTNGKVEAFNPNAKYATDLHGGLEAFAYGQLFSGVDNRKWYRQMLAGNASFAEHMAPYYQMVQRMIDHGILTPASFSYSYTTRSKKFIAGEIAMINNTSDINFQDSSSFGIFPFPSLDGKEQYVSSRQSYNLSVVKKKRDAAQQQAIKAFVSFFATPEAQQLCEGGKLMTSSVKGTPVTYFPYQEGLKTTINGGFYFKRLDFKGYAIPDKYSVLESMRADFLAMAKGEKTVSQAVTEREQSIKEAAVHPEPHLDCNVVGTATADFTTLETSFFIADVFRKKTGSDIALIPHGTPFRGNLQRLLKGEILDKELSFLQPRSLDNNTKLVNVEMTGAQLKQALDHPNGYSANPENCLYAYSGLKATVAPLRKPGSKYLAITLMDGTPLEDDKTYTVSFWQGMVSPQYYQKTLTVYEDSFPSILTEEVKKNQTITPSQDGRMTIDWR